MRISLTYNEKKSDSVAEAELLTRQEIETIKKAIEAGGHKVLPVRVSVAPETFIDDLMNSRPELVFNVAEGLKGEGREAKYPAIFNMLKLPYTGGGASLQHISLDKRLTEKILNRAGVNVPGGCLISRDEKDIPGDLSYPVLIKPNYEGSSKGITDESIVESPEEAREVVEKMLEEFPEGLDLEEFIEGREITVPLLEAFPGRFLEIVEHIIKHDGEYNIYNYRDKHPADGEFNDVYRCPPELTPEEHCNIMAMADLVDQVLPCRDMGRIDMRLNKEGVPYFLEINALPRLLPDGSLAIAAEARGMDYEKMFDMIIRSAARRYGLSERPKAVYTGKAKPGRTTARESGITVGRFPAGRYNAITDVEGVKAGHITHIRDNVEVPGRKDERSCVRTGITAICPHLETLFHEHLVAGAFVLNGIGEMAGITQVREWGWLETPILLTNTMSVGRVHDGIIQHLVETYPELGREVGVAIPIVGETNDAFLNDVRIYCNTPEDAMKAIATARGGPVEQGSVGGGAGMQTFDFAGGIGSSSRVIPPDSPGGRGYAVGVLVQSNFGKMRNLTVDGLVAGRELDKMYPDEGRRRNNYGSVIVVVATDAPLMTPQLNRLSKRAALGLGRVGSYAASTSGEIIMAFSTANQVSRKVKATSRVLNLTSVTDERIDPLYEAVIEATEESVLNAMFCSGGQTGRSGRSAPPIPGDKIREMLDR